MLGQTARLPGVQLEMAMERANGVRQNLPIGRGEEGRRGVTGIKHVQESRFLGLEDVVKDVLSD